MFSPKPTHWTVLPPMKILAETEKKDLLEMTVSHGTLARTMTRNMIAAANTKMRTAASRAALLADDP